MNPIEKTITPIRNAMRNMIITDVPKECPVFRISFSSIAKTSSAKNTLLLKAFYVISLKRQHLADCSSFLRSLVNIQCEQFPTRPVQVLSTHFSLHVWSDVMQPTMTSFPSLLWKAPCESSTSPQPITKSITQWQNNGASAKYFLWILCCSGSGNEVVNAFLLDEQDIIWSCRRLLQNIKQCYLHIWAWRRELVGVDRLQQ